MAFSMYDASVAVFVPMLHTLSGIVAKGSAFATAKKIDPAVLLATRLYPDMFPLIRQVQFASDFAKGPSARLAGLEPPKFPDEEKTFEDLQARIIKTIEFVQSVDAAAIEASADRSIAFTMGGTARTMKGSDYLMHLQLPQFYFHHTTAYIILRSIGVDVGKRDYLGTPKGMM